jgi:hypothetical protein
VNHRDLGSGQGATGDARSAAREFAVIDLRAKRQQVSAFLLRLGRHTGAAQDVDRRI